MLIFAQERTQWTDNERDPRLAKKIEDELNKDKALASAETSFNAEPEKNLNSRVAATMTNGHLKAIRVS